MDLCAFQCTNICQHVDLLCNINKANCIKDPKKDFPFLPFYLRLQVNTPADGLDDPTTLSVEEMLKCLKLPEDNTQVI